MKKVLKSISGWANYPRLKSEVFEPRDRVGVRSVILDNQRIIPRGNGKSYGDAALAPKVLSTLGLNKILSFDEEQGLIECESGVLLSDLLKRMVPGGWFFHVTPGIKEITVGGAIASDVHGKNHPTAGCFSNHLISFQLMTADAEVKHCSRSENRDLFWQTCGGMGWTGVVLSAKFRLLKITSTVMLQKSVKTDNLYSLFQNFEENRDWPYAAGWIDCTSSNWRGAVFLAAHDEGKEPAKPLYFKEETIRTIPCYAPSWLLNAISIRVYNYLYFNKVQEGEQLVPFDKYFYPLDSLRHWNRLYGRRGFIQYQLCLPEKHAFKGIQQVLKTIRQSSETPFLTVLKRHGERAPEAVHSFPIKGYSLALDFPRTRGIFDLVKKLDTLVWSLEGKIYLTKDACSEPKMGCVNPSGFGEEKFSSLLKERILGV